MRIFFTSFSICMSFFAAAQQLNFPPLDTNYRALEIRVSSSLKMDVLFEGNRDAVWNGSEYAIAKTWQDFVGLHPLGTGNDSVLLIVNHEMRANAKNPKLGDGGGMTVFRANKDINGRWKPVARNGHKFQNVDFSHIRGTIANCAGATIGGGKFMTAEEWTFESNQDGLLLSSFRDTSDYVIPSGPFKNKRIPFYQNFGYMVVVDALQAKALYKSYAMGRNSFEGGWVMPDQKTVYLMVDATPAPIYKFVADTAGKFEYGQLYFYKQGSLGYPGDWFALPRDWDSLYNVNEMAFRRGATLFTRLEWAVEHNNKLYIAETGNDNSNYKTAVQLGGIPSEHFLRFDTLGGQPKDTTFADYYGRVLELDLTTNVLRPYLEGGVGTRFTFSNPDGLSIHKQNGKTYLIVVEDLNGISYQRSGQNGYAICEAFFLDLSLPNPTLNDLRPFVTSSSGAELTGSVSTPDGKTMFICNQHPSSNNIPPFNNDALIALTGFSMNTPTQEVKVSATFSIYPNPATEMVYFNQNTDVSLYNANGQRLRVERNIQQLFVGDLTPGIYFLQTLRGEVVKLVKQ